MLKFSSVAGRHVAAVRIEAGGHRGEIALQQFIVIGLLPALADAVVTFAELRDRLIHGDVVGDFLEQIELHALPPTLDRLLGRFRKCRGLGVANHFLVDSEIMRLIQLGHAP